LPQHEGVLGTDRHNERQSRQETGEGSGEHSSTVDRPAS
jgi:hypothetical protein